MGRILIKLGENVGTSVQLYQNFIALCRSGFTLRNFCEREAQDAHERSEKDASANMLLQTVTLATAIISFDKSSLFETL